MKLGMKIVTGVVILIILIIVIDMTCIFTIFKPLFAIKQSDTLYKGLFYDTYICEHYTVPQIKAKWTKYSCVELPQEGSTFEIIDTTEVCAEALEGIYKDLTGEYYLPCIKSQNIFIKFSDGSKYNLMYVLGNNILTIQELIDGGLEVYKY